MKKNIITLALALSIMSVNTQTETKTADNLNKWFIELSGGFNKP